MVSVALIGYGYDGYDTVELFSSDKAAADYLVNEVMDTVDPDDLKDEGYESEEAFIKDFRDELATGRKVERFGTSYALFHRQVSNG